MAVSLPRTAGSRDTVTASFAEYDPLREPAMRPIAVPGVRPDHDGVRQVLHLLHRPVGPRARAEPAARTRSSTRPEPSPSRGSARSPSSARRSTATSTPKGPADGSTGGPPRTVARHRRDQPDQVHHELSQRHDRRPPGRDPRPAQGLALSPRPGAERLQRDPQADEAWIYRRAVRRHDGSNQAHPARRVGVERLHRRLLR